MTPWAHQSLKRKNQLKLLCPYTSRLKTNKAKDKIKRQALTIAAAAAVTPKTAECFFICGSSALGTKQRAQSV